MSITFQVFNDVFLGVLEAVANVFFHYFIIQYVPVDENLTKVYYYFDIHRNNNFS